MSGRRELRPLHLESRSGNSCSGSTGHWPTALELEESTALFSLSSDGGGEGRGEEPRFYWFSPLPIPLPARSSQGEGDRRPALQCLIQREWATGLCRPATRRTERGPRAEPIKTRVLEEGDSLFRSAGRRPARAGRPCYPFSGHAIRAGLNTGALQRTAAVLPCSVRGGGADALFAFNPARQRRSLSLV